MIVNIVITIFACVMLFLLRTLYKAAYLVRQAEVIVIERFGHFHQVMGPGLHFIVPFIDQPRRVLWTFLKEDARGRVVHRFTELVERIDLREAVYDFPKQNVITRDNVTIEINGLLYYQITDPKASLYEVANLPQAIEKLTQTSMRNIIGSMDLDETLTSRDRINEKLRNVLDEATDKWGIKINRVELQEINPPEDIRIAMEKQMRAERDRRATILEAEGRKHAAILEAEGDNLSAITRANGEAEARLRLAQADADSRRVVAIAEAEALRTIQAGLPGDNAAQYLLAKSYIDMLPKIGSDGQTKIVMMPYEASALMGSAASIKELLGASALKTD